MKILKINTDGSSEYSIEEGNFKIITEIGKDEILKLIQLIINMEEVEMDNPEENTIHNEAQKIIYCDLYSKLSDIVTKKETIITDVNNEIQPVLSKYGISIND